MPAPFPPPDDGQARSEALAPSQSPEPFSTEAFEELAQLAAELCATPIAAISLIDEARLRFVARVGFDHEVDLVVMPREHSFGVHALESCELFVVPDATQDPRFAANRFVVGEARVRFYAGMPLCAEDGTRIGVIAVMDRVPRDLTEGQRTGLRTLSRQVMAQFELRRRLGELETSERNRASVMDSSMDGIVVFDAEGRVLEFNRAAEALFGYSRAEVVGRPMVETLIPPDLRPTHRARLDLITAAADIGTVGRRIEQWAWHAKGYRFPAEVSAMRRQGAEPPQYVGFVRDITARKEAEAALRRSEGRLQAVIEHMAEGLIIARLDGELLYWNPAALEMHGVTNFEESLARFRAGTSVLDLCTPEGRVLSPAEWPLPRLLRGEPLRGLELRLRKKEGDWQRVCLYNGAIVREPGGEELAFLTVQDITERQRGEARLRRLVDSNVQGVFFWDASGTVLDANDAFLQMVGYSREELTSGALNWITLSPPEVAEADRKAVHELATKTVCTPYEKEYLRKDGTRVPVFIGAARFEDGSGEGVSFVLDLTERKQLEQQFLRAQRLESIGTLAGGIAHDLNNALAPVITGMQLLELGFPNPSDQKLLSMIGTSARRGADMVKQVLSFARGVAGERLTIQVRYLIKELADVVYETFPKDIRVQTQVPADLWTVVGDATQIHQVLLNLCVNARDAMPQGGVLTISAENLWVDAQYAGLSIEAKPGPYIVLQVEDSGTGIAPEILDKVFDPFFTTKEPGKGTGLGLSTTVGIVRSHGGFVLVQSGTGRGTQFKLYLPANPEGAEPDSPPVEDPLPRGHGEWVLLVDDEATVRTITAQTLETYGYQVVTAVDGADALSIYAPRMAEIAVALVDMMMPVMDGSSVMQVLRRMNPGLPMVVASGLSTDAQAARAASLGVEHFLAKPYTASALLTVLRRVLDGAETP